jgi:hypothetical protein
MAKRGNGGKQTKAGDTTSTMSGGATAATPDPMEQRIVAFAAQLGRIAGTVQAKAEGWMDRDALNKQIAGVRDSASELLEQMKTTVTTVNGSRASKTDAATGKKSAGAASTSNAKGRSGGVVDAPGKKHRKPMPRDPRAMAADSKPARVRAGEMNKTVRKLRAPRG